MFERILYPTDFSDVSMKAMNCIKQLKGAGAREVTVLHVIDERFMMGPAYEVYVDFTAMENEMRKVADGEGNKIVEQLRQGGLSAKFKVEKGIPFLTILKTAKEENVSMIVIGSHGKSNLEEMLLGSVSEEVIRKATQPVLVVKR